MIEHSYGVSKIWSNPNKWHCLTCSLRTEDPEENVEFTAFLVNDQIAA